MAQGFMLTRTSARMPGHSGGRSLMSGGGAPERGREGHPFRAPSLNHSQSTKAPRALETPLEGALAAAMMTPMTTNTVIARKM